MSRKTRTRTQRRARKARNAAKLERVLDTGPRIDGPGAVVLYARGRDEPVLSLVGTGEFMAFEFDDDGNPVLHRLAAGNA